MSITCTYCRKILETYIKTLNTGTNQLHSATTRVFHSSWTNPGTDCDKQKPYTIATTEVTEKAKYSANSIHTMESHMCWTVMSPSTKRVKKSLLE